MNEGDSLKIKVDEKTIEVVEVSWWCMKVCYDSEEVCYNYGE